MNKQDIVNEINRLQAELPLRVKIAEIAEHEGLELAVNELTENCCASVKSKSYKNSVDKIKDLKAIASFQDYLQSQQDRIEAIETRIAQLKIELTRCQLSLFEEESGTNKRLTGAEFEGRELCTGDLFETRDKNYLLVCESQDDPEKFAIFHSASNTELLLNYPKNKEALKETAYLGNLFEDDRLQAILEKIMPEESEEQDESGNEEK